MNSRYVSFVVLDAFDVGNRYVALDGGRACVCAGDVPLLVVDGSSGGTDGGQQRNEGELHGAVGVGGR